MAMLKWRAKPLCQAAKTQEAKRGPFTVSPFWGGQFSLTNAGLPRREFTLPDVEQLGRLLLVVEFSMGLTEPFRGTAP